MRCPLPPSHLVTFTSRVQAVHQAPQVFGRRSSTRPRDRPITTPSKHVSTTTAVSSRNLLLASKFCTTTTSDRQAGGHAGDRKIEQRKEATQIAVLHGAPRTEVIRRKRSMVPPYVASKSSICSLSSSSDTNFFASATSVVLVFFFCYGGRAHGLKKKYPVRTNELAQVRIQRGGVGEGGRFAMLIPMYSKTGVFEVRPLLGLRTRVLPVLNLHNPTYTSYLFLYTRY